MLPDTSCIHLYRLHVSCIGDKIVASLLLDTETEVDRDINGIVIMSPRYSPQVSRTSNLYPSTYSLCIWIQVDRPGYMRHVAYPGVNAVKVTEQCTAQALWLD